MNLDDSETRPVLGPAGNARNEVGPILSARNMVFSKPVVVRKIDKPPVEVTKPKDKIPLHSSKLTTLSPKSHSSAVPSMLRRHEQLLHSNFSMNASCSSDCSTDSFHSRPSTGRRFTRSNSTGTRRNQFPAKPRSVVSDGCLDSPPPDGSQKKQCAWVTPNTDPCYAAFHDEEWGVPVHDDKKLFEILVLSGALAELSWPAILSKRHIFREVFADFDPVCVSQLNEKKLIAPGSTASSLLSELKLRAITENARQITKGCQLSLLVTPKASHMSSSLFISCHLPLFNRLVINEFGSFDKYIWSFVNNKPIISKFRYPRQIPVKTPKADAISKDLVRRGFRSVGPTVIYSFMQVAGLTNDHLISCFRYQECIAMAEGKEENGITDKSKDKKANDVMESELSRAIDEFSFSSEC
ncbi:hypothetical protein ACFE04_000078 [Oxalis oulophora]